MSAKKVAAFFNVFKSGESRAQKVASFLNLFSADSGAPPNNLPVVGITVHTTGQILGPGFRGRTNIRHLFDKLFESFDPVALTPTGEPLLFSADRRTYGRQATLTGTYVAKWFEQPHPGHSLPLSGIRVVDAAHRGPKATTVPACPIFVFDDTDHIAHLSIYMDRYRLMSDLAGTLPNAFDPALSKLLHQLHEDMVRL